MVPPVLERLLFLALKSLKNLSDLFLPDSVGSVGSCVLGGIFGTVCASRIFKTPGGCVVIEKIAIVFSENPKSDIVTKRATFQPISALGELVVLRCLGVWILILAMCRFKCVLGRGG